MNILYKWLFVLFCFVAAIASYSVGSMRGFGLFLILGVLFEMGFWIGIFKVKVKRKDKEEKV